MHGTPHKRYPTELKSYLFLLFASSFRLFYWCVCVFVCAFICIQRAKLASTCEQTKKATGKQTRMACQLHPCARNVEYAPREEYLKTENR